jgi:hypothetical protein
VIVACGISHMHSALCLSEMEVEVGIGGQNLIGRSAAINCSFLDAVWGLPSVCYLLLSLASSSLCLIRTASDGSSFFLIGP